MQEFQIFAIGKTAYLCKREIARAYSMCFKVIKIDESFRVNELKKFTVRKKEIFRRSLYFGNS